MLPQTNLKRTLILLVCFFCFLISSSRLSVAAEDASVTPSATDPYFETPSDYFVFRMKNGRGLPSPSKRNPLSIPYINRAHEQFTSNKDDGASWDKTRHTSFTPSSEQFKYDATLAYDTFNLDHHPYVIDIGCTKNVLYIRPDEKYVKLLKEQFSVGNLLVSTKKNLICHDHSLNDRAESDEKVLYRLITKSELLFSKENGISYFQLETAKLSLLQVFSKLKLLKSKPLGYTSSTHSNRFTGSSGNERAFEMGWNVKRDGSGKIIYSNNVPTHDKSSVTGSISTISYECTNCYFSFYAGYYIYLETDMPWDILDTARGKGFYNLRVNLPTLKISAEAQIEREFELLKKKDFFTAFFSVGPIPVEMSIGFGLGMSVGLEGKGSISYSSDYVRSGSAGFEYIEGDHKKTVTSGSTSGSLKVLETLSLQTQAKFALKPTLFITFYELFPIVFKINPYIKVKTQTNPNSGCRLGMNVYWGIDGEVGIDEIELLEYTIWDGYTYVFSIVSETAIPSLCGICLKKSRRSIENTLSIDTIHSVNELTANSEIITDNSTIVAKNLIIAQDNFDFYDGITLTFGFTIACQISYGSVSFELSQESIQIPFINLINQNTTQIKIIISKGSTEQVSIDYKYYRSSIPFGKSVKIRSGLLLIDIPSILPDYLSFSLSNGQLSLMDGSPVGDLLAVNANSFPLFISFTGSDANVTIFPAYKGQSGRTVRHVFDGDQSKMAIVYTPNTGILQTLHSFLLTPTLPKHADVTLKMTTGSVFSTSSIVNMPNSVTMSKSGTSLNSIPNIIYIEVVGSFSPELELNIEPLEVYQLDLTSDLSFKYSTLSPFGLSISRDSSYGNLGMVIGMGNSTQGYIGYNLQSEENKYDSVYTSKASRRNSFGFSKHSNSGLMDGAFFMRVESRAMMRNMVDTVSGKIDFTQLKNENITASIKFTTNDGKLTDQLNFGDLIKEHNIYLCITINDPQYTFNQNYIGGANTFVKFINSIRTKEERSNWNDIILPMLSYSITLNTYKVILENPQTMKIKLPVYPQFERKTEKVMFTTLSTHIFLPEPLQAQAEGTLNAESGIALTQGDIGAIIASVVGFTIIVVLVFALVLVIVMWKCGKSATILPKDIENQVQEILVVKR